MHVLESSRSLLMQGLRNLTFYFVLAKKGSQAFELIRSIKAWLYRDHCMRATHYKALCSDLEQSPCVLIRPHTPASK